VSYEVEISATAVAELKTVRPFEQRRIVDEIADQLSTQPDVSSRNRKCLNNATPSFECVLPIWELRIGEFRVFYDIDRANQKVIVRAIRQKKQGQTTGEIIS